jgi:hypothetical protein
VATAVTVAQYIAAKLPKWRRVAASETCFTTAKPGHLVWTGRPRSRIGLSAWQKGT